PRASILERPREERPPLLVEQIERDEDRPAPAFRRLRPEPSSQEVVARPASRIADDDLAVQERSLGQRHVAELRDERKEIAAGPVGDAQAARVARRERTDPVPLPLEEGLG